jgi:hypothetical protein
LVPLDLNKRQKKLKLVETKRKHELAEKEKLLALDREKYNNGHSEILTIFINIIVYGFILPK